MDKSVKCVGKVFSTTNYGLFKIVESNRPIKTTGVRYKRLKNSIKEKGQIEPAIVNENYEIINGQHRWCVCKELGVPFIFEVWEGLRITDVPDANFGTEWKQREFIHMYATNGCEQTTSYQYLSALLKEFCPTLSFSAVLTILGLRGGNSQTVLQEGRFSLSSREYENASRCIRDLIELGYYQWLKENKRSSNAYWLAVAYVWRHPKVDCERMIKIMWHNSLRIPSSTKTSEYLDMFSKLYNKGLSKEKKVYLDKDYDQKMYRKWEDVK